ncbi:MAG: guanylate kinase [Cryomorphaceae bacterium]|nr:MAG: guanylate kinase [Cryomorphaceae bacterium]
MRGKAIILSAPSGAGKTTIVHHLLDQPLNLAFSVSACSRPMRSHEKNGVDYHFLSVEDFRKRIAEDAFVEWEEVYPDMYYGTLRSEVERIWARGEHVVFDVDVKGGINLKKALGDRALSIFVQPPSIEVLEARLRNRGTESEETLKRRVGKARKELEDAIHFDVVLLNDDLQIALKQATETVQSFIKS